MNKRTLIAQATKLRRTRMEACVARGGDGRCACKLRCDLTLKPPLTFAEAEARKAPYSKLKEWP